MIPHLSLSYQDVSLIPTYNPEPSRNDYETKIAFGHQTFKLPVVPANMACVINTDLARWMSRDGYFYIMHRFNKDVSSPPNFDNEKFLRTANEERWKTISISLGVQNYDKRFLEMALQNRYRIDYLTLDIAHAHSLLMKEMLEFVLKLNVIDVAPFIIVGNVAASEAVADVTSWGAQAIKVGIAQGGACTTYGQTGFGTPMFSCMMECSAATKVPLIADGGVKVNGDIAKALRAGGTMVMAGSLFAACKDAPGETTVRNEETGEWLLDFPDLNDANSCRRVPVLRPKTYKRYYGSASIYNKHINRHVEGTMVELPCNGMTYEEKLLEVTDSLQSSFSYAGGKITSVGWNVRRE
jgi:GMP reductase